MFFLFISFISVGVSYFFEKLWAQSLELSRGIKNRKKFTLKLLTASQHLLWINITFYKWRNWDPMRWSPSIKFCNLWVGQIFLKRHGIYVGMSQVLMSQVFSNYITAINHLDIENSWSPKTFFLTISSQSRPPTPAMCCPRTWGCVMLSFFSLACCIVLTVH